MEVEPNIGGNMVLRDDGHKTISANASHQKSLVIVHWGHVPDSLHDMGMKFGGGPGRLAGRT